jgi:hypothetical protein
MSKKQQALSFVEQLATLRFDDTFNPYSDSCPDHDSVNAAHIRRDNLAIVVEAALESGVDSIWIARDLGYRGGRRTGLALTDELHLTMHAELFNTRPLQRATTGPALGERTASVVWQVLREIDRLIFLWNVFPLHPHVHGDPMTNRCHTRTERAGCHPLLVRLLRMLKPKRIIAIGQDARNALEEQKVDVVAVRHPSYGGQAAFVAGIREVYGYPSRSEVQLQQSVIPYDVAEISDGRGRVPS